MSFFNSTQKVTYKVCKPTHRDEHQLRRTGRKLVEPPGRFPKCAGASAIADRCSGTGANHTPRATNTGQKLQIGEEPRLGNSAISAGTSPEGGRIHGVGGTLAGTEISLLPVGARRGREAEVRQLQGLPVQQQQRAKTALLQGNVLRVCSECVGYFFCYRERPAGPVLLGCGPVPTTGPAGNGEREMRHFLTAEPQERLSCY